MANTTYHADLRARKRIGVSDISAQFEAALEHGTHQRELKGSLARFIDQSARTHRHSCVIYKGQVYWYAPKTNTLITVIPLHQKWHKYVKASGGNG